MDEVIRILIVEDMPTDAELAKREISKTLQASVFRRVETREDYLTALEDFQPDVIVSDYSMPHFDGLTALKLALERVPLTPLIILTGSMNEDTAVECMKAGASNYVIKEHIKRLGQSVIHALAEKQLREERHRAEQALRESEEKYRNLVERANDGITIIQDGAAKYVNPRLAEMWGSSVEKIIGTPFTDYIFPDELPKVAERYKRRMAGEDIPPMYETVLMRKDDSKVHVELNAGLITYQGKPADLVIVRDITERKQVEKALRESEARYRARTEELETLFTLSARLREAQTADDILPVVLREMQRVLKTDAVVVAFFDADSDRFTVALADGSIAPDIGQTIGHDENISPQVLRTRWSFVTDDYATDPNRWMELSHAEQIGPAIIVPLQSENEYLGILMASRRKSPQAQPFSPEEVRLLTAMGEMAGNALRRARLFDDVQRHLRRTQALHDFQLTVASSFDLQLTLRAALEHALAQLKVDAAAVLLFDSHTLTLEYAAGRGFCTRAVEHSRLRLGEGYAGRALLERQMICIPNLSEAGGEFVSSPLIAGEGFVAYYGVPLIAKEQVKGVLEVLHRTPLPVDKEWLAFLETLAGQVAIAIDNLTLFTALQNSNAQLVLAYDATIGGLSRALDLRDKETEGHAQRVVEMTMVLARAMGMNDAELVHVRRGALLHDMGKMGIPDAILLKPDKLTPEEWAIMRRHPQYAFDMFSPIEYLHPALDIPYCHHEKWDGTGYPRGLKGEEIPLAARIFAVVDVWDAVTSERPYRHVWSKKEALAYICEQAGKHFDPRVVEAFLPILREEQG